MRVVVTGAAGFIGSNIVRGLNTVGIDDIVAVDDLTDARKFENLRDLKICDYFDRSEFYDLFASRALGKFDVVLHQGACSDTMEHNGQFMLDINYRCSKRLLDGCLQQGTRLLYASSAAVYGGSPIFIERPQYEIPLNVYGYSKLLFDQVVRRLLPTAAIQIAGFRYFNVYGPHEQHKGRMASVALHNFQELHKEGRVCLFGEYGGHAPGCQSRDFIYVEDAVAVNLWFLNHPEAHGIFNVGTGRAQPFNDIASAVVNAQRQRSGKAAAGLGDLVTQGNIAYVDFPESLQGKYQCFTQADLTALRAVGCDVEFVPVEIGVKRYTDWLFGNR